jgi:hypothetical protein
MPDQSRFYREPEGAARELSERFLAKIDSDEGMPVLEDLPQHLYTADVESAVYDYRRQFRFCHYSGIPFFCLDLGQAEPTNISWLSGFPVLYPPFDNYLRNLRSEDFQQLGISEKVITVSSEESFRFFAAGLTRFLAVRLSSLVASSLGPLFTVNTKHKNDRVHFTLVFSLNLASAPVFGSPTTPVSKPLAPGIYHFGVSSSAMANIQRDFARWDTKVTNVAHLCV